MAIENTTAAVKLTPQAVAKIKQTAAECRALAKQMASEKNNPSVSRNYYQMEGKADALEAVLAAFTGNLRELDML